MFYQDELMNHSIVIRRIFKLMVLFTVIFAVLFCIAWQNIQLYMMNRNIKSLVKKRNELEKSIYLLNMKLSTLKSRERMRKIAVGKLHMVPITSKDIKLIVY